jgi:hypothetical protein
LLDQFIQDYIHENHHTAHAEIIRTLGKTGSCTTLIANYSRRGEAKVHEEEEKGNTQWSAWKKVRDCVLLSGMLQLRM